MPFLGKDWRSYGDEWIRTEHGWERTKVLECILDNLNSGLRKDLFKSNCRKKPIRFSCGEEDTNEEEDSCNRCRTITESSFESSSSTCIAEETNDYDLNELNEFYDSDNDDSDIEDEVEDDYDQKSCMSYSDPAIRKNKRKSCSLRRLCISTSSLDRKPRQPHIMYLGHDGENNGPKLSVSEVLNALDMPGAVKDIKRFNYVCRLVQLVINEKLNQLSGNAQRTLFMIVKEMLIQVIKTQENLNVMRKLLVDFKKKIQDCCYFHFFYIGSQKLGEKHLIKINKWQEILDNPNHKKVKRLTRNIKIVNNKINTDKEQTDKENNRSVDFENIPFDCKLEIMRRLNTGLDLVNLSKCSKSLNEIISQELAIWKNLCMFHFQQTNINSFVNKSLSLKSGKQRSSKQEDTSCSIKKENHEEKQSINNLSQLEQNNENLDWKQIYFKLKKRYGHREVYVNMVHKCFYCKCLFWKEIGHPCIIAASISDQMNALEARTEPITPKKLIELLLK